MAQACACLCQHGSVDFDRYSNTHTHTHPFNGPMSGTTRVSRYQEGKTNLDFTEARDSEWQWHQLGRMQVCTSLQPDNHASTPPLSCFFTGRMPFLPRNQQRQSTEGNNGNDHYSKFSNDGVLCAKDVLCSPSAILDGSGLADVARTVRAMVTASIQLRQSAV